MVLWNHHCTRRYLNATFKTAVKPHSSYYPVYSLVTLAQLRSSARNQPRQLSSAVTIYTRPCRRGEKFDLDSPTRSTCSMCEDSYSLVENIDNSIVQCNACPSGADKCFGSTILLKRGSWRWNENAMTIFTCPYPRGYIGGNSTGEKLCASGYSGEMIAVYMYTNLHCLIEWLDLYRGYIDWLTYHFFIPFGFVDARSILWNMHIGLLFINIFQRLLDVPRIIGLITRCRCLNTASSSG